MTDIQTLRAEAAQSRAAADGEEVMRAPQGRPVKYPVRAPSELRAKKVTKDDKDWFEVEGYASVVERGYDMWDMYGPYTEVVSAGAFDKTLAAQPEVVFRFNHGGTPMAGTTNGRLELWADETGLGDRAWLNPNREDVKLLIQAIEDGDVREQSFMFEIVRGQWSPDYTEYRIEEVNLDRGDVGGVSYGASPYTSIATRSGDFLRDIPKLPPLVAREALERLAERADIELVSPSTPEPTEGPSLALIRAQLDAEKDLGL